MDEDIVAIVAATFVISIPLLAISARIALKPIAEAIARLRGDPTMGAQGETLRDRRLAHMEHDLEQVVGELRELREAIRFQNELQSPEPAPRLPAAESSRAGGELDGV